MLQFARENEHEAGTTSLVLERQETAPGAVAVLTFDRLLDDSVRAQRYELQLRETNGTWHVESTRLTHRCWPDRGHQDFSAAPCV